MGVKEFAKKRFEDLGSGTATGLGGALATAALGWWKWEWLTKYSAVAWAWLMKPFTVTYLTAGVVSAVLAVVGIIILVICYQIFISKAGGADETSNQAPDWFSHFREAQFEGLLWRWAYSGYGPNSRITRLVSYCPRCRFQLSFSGAYFDSQYQCERCGFKKAFQKDSDAVENLVERHIHHAVNEGLWKNYVTHNG